MLPQQCTANNARSRLASRTFAHCYSSQHKRHFIWVLLMCRMRWTSSGVMHNNVASEGDYNRNHPGPSVPSQRVLMPQEQTEHLTTSDMRIYPYVFRTRKSAVMKCHKKQAAEARAAIKQAFPAHLPKVQLLLLYNFLVPQSGAERNGTERIGAEPAIKAERHASAF